MLGYMEDVLRLEGYWGGDEGWVILRMRAAVKV